jgi:hypothetical protein
MPRSKRPHVDHVDHLTRRTSELEEEGLRHPGRILAGTGHTGQVATRLPRQVGRFRLTGRKVGPEVRIDYT